MRPPIRKAARPKAPPVAEPISEVGIRDEYITLQQLLKWENLIGTGGEAKHFLANNSITMNGEAEDRRGRKLRVGDSIRVPGVGIYNIILAPAETDDEVTRG